MEAQAGVGLRNVDGVHSASGRKGRPHVEKPRSQEGDSTDGLVHPPSINCYLIMTCGGVGINPDRLLGIADNPERY